MANITCRWHCKGCCLPFITTEIQPYKLPNRYKQRIVYASHNNVHSHRPNIHMDRWYTKMTSFTIANVCLLTLRI